MKLVKQLLIVSSISIFHSIYTAWPMGVNPKIFDSYVAKAYTKLNEANQQLQSEDQCYEWTNASYADALFGRQKAAFKLLLEEIEHNEKNEILNQHFKHEVYKSWKRSFLNNYIQSLNSNDPHAWDWLYKPVSIEIHE